MEVSGKLRAPVALRVDLFKLLPLFGYITAETWQYAFYFSCTLSSSGKKKRTIEILPVIWRNLLSRRLGDDDDG
jgi:hypothetical protein